MSVVGTVAVAAATVPLRQLAFAFGFAFPVVALFALLCVFQLDCDFG
jgi:hypothetical protein